MVRFVESDSTGLPLKRKQVAQACARCRRRKKRCSHNLDGRTNLNEPPIHSTPNSIPRATEAAPQAPQASPNPQALPQLDNLPERSDSRSASRFVGYLSPEAILMEATSLCAQRDLSVGGGLGIWKSRAPDLANSNSPGPLTSPPRHILQNMLKAYVWSHCVVCCPSPSDYAVLLRIYLEKLDPIFPILNCHLTNTSRDEIGEKVLQQIVSLAAAADPEATRHLRLTPDGPLLSRHDFSSSLSNSIQTIIDAGLITDRVFLTRILAALSLYMQPSSPEEADVPAFLNSHAVHQMHTLGLQMAAEDSDSNTRTLFCSVWALDRLNSAFYGRACLIHERDVGWNIDDCISRQSPPFRLLLMIIGLLDKVIGLYRPGNRQEKDFITELPIFEQMIIDAGAARISNPCLGMYIPSWHPIYVG